MPADFLEPDTQIAVLRDQNAAAMAAAIKAGQPEQGFELGNRGISAGDFTCQGLLLTIWGR